MIMRVVVANIVIAYVMFVLFAYFVSDSMIFVPPRASYKNSPEFLKLTIADGETIFALYLPNKSAKYTLLMNHGNAEDIGYVVPIAQAMHDHGFSVLIYDYPGYGLSSGNPTESNAYLSANAAYDYLTKNLHVASKDIIIYGHSLGAAVALDLAVREPVAAIILQGGFVTAFRVITYIPLLPFDKFNNLKKITQLKCPLLVIHGTADRVVPFWHGQMLYDTALVSKQFYRVKNAGHNDVLDITGAEYWQEIENFLRKSRLT